MRFTKIERNLAAVWLVVMAFLVIFGIAAHNSANARTRMAHAAYVRETGVNVSYEEFNALRLTRALPYTTNSRK